MFDRYSRLDLDSQKDPDISAFRCLTGSYYPHIAPQSLASPDVPKQQVLYPYVQ